MDRYNRIVIIGNGFDKAAGLKTGYSDFINFYVKNAVGFFLSEHEYDSNLLSIRGNGKNFSEPFMQLLDHLDKQETAIDALNFIRRISVPKFKYSFFEEIIKNENERWVDIEQFYFDKLISIYRLSGPRYPEDYKVKQISILNQFMDEITVELNNYISKINSNAKISLLNSPLKPLVEKCQIALRPDVANLTKRHMRTKDPEKVIFLNFNYTNTLKNLTNNSFLKENFIHINIHGEVENNGNPIIFGYGDDTNDDYKKLELQDNNELIRKIKSFQYPRTRNYHQLLNILESADFDVFIIGHSCGLSDRTLLKTIFEHDNCIAIQNFHYKGESDDFNKRMQISRHFANKMLMRERVLPFDEQATIPQVN